MKLKPFAKWYNFYVYLFFISILGIYICANERFETVGGFFFIALIISGSRIFGMSIDAEVKKYGLFGRRCGADPYYEYEPGDPEYEKEKRWQDLEEERERKD